MTRLQEYLSKAYSSPYSYAYITCPICNNKSCAPGEWVEHAKVSPDHCWICGWREGNGTVAYPCEDEYFNKCWELQIAPYGQLEM